MSRILAALLLTLSLVLSPSPQQAEKAPPPHKREVKPPAVRLPEAVPCWIWRGKEPRDGQTVFFRKNFTLTSPVKAARIYGACDNKMLVSINGKEVLSSDSWDNPVSADVTSLLKVGVPGGFPDPNLITVKAHNSDGPAGLLLRLVIETADKNTTTIVTDTNTTPSVYDASAKAMPRGITRSWNGSTPCACKA